MEVGSVVNTVTQGVRGGGGGGNTIWVGKANGGRDRFGKKLE
jgi:hypothetical protein